MKVILLQDVPKVGKKFETKTISDGYGINFLLPQKLAKLATHQVIKELAVLKEKYDTEQQKRFEISKELIQQLNDKVIEVDTKASSEGKLFAGLGKQEVTKIIKDKTGIEIDHNLLQLDKPIKEVGKYSIEIRSGEEKGQLNLVVMGKK